MYYTKISLGGPVKTSSSLHSKTKTQLSTNKLKSFDESYKAWMIYAALIEVVQESCYFVLLKKKMNPH